MMKTFFVVFIFLASVLPIMGQEDFVMDNELQKVTIPFKFINNLIFIPIKVNGVELNFLLDSGVEETILFSLEEKKEVSFFNVEKILLRGLGSETPIEALKSRNNTLEINGFKSTNHLLYVVLDQSFNLSSHIGIPVNGIIGYKIFKNNLVEINYEKKRVSVYSEDAKIKKRIEKKLQRVPITIERAKPYILGNVTINAVEIPTKLLIDIGNSDALWLFENKEKSINVPSKNFEDYLGKGFSGDVEGRRAQIDKFSFSRFEFNRPIVAFPDSSSIQNVKMVKDRAGSVGSEILKRFDIFFDYPNEQLYVRKNRNFSTSFSYNKSGVEVQHFGLQWVQETVRLETVPYKGATVVEDGSINLSNFKYKFVLKPIYVVAHVRKNSLAARSGLQKGDIIIKINQKPGYEFTLEKINALLKSEEEDWISFEIERDSQIMTFKFQLLNVL